MKKTTANISTVYPSQFTRAKRMNAVSPNSPSRISGQNFQETISRLSVEVLISSSSKHNTEASLLAYSPPIYIFLALVASSPHLSHNLPASHNIIHALLLFGPCKRTLSQRSIVLGHGFTRCHEQRPQERRHRSIVTALCLLHHVSTGLEGKMRVFLDYGMVSRICAYDTIEIDEGGVAVCFSIVEDTLDP